MSHKPPITVREAIQRIESTLTSIAGDDQVALSDALGRVLLEPLLATLDVPARPTSAMDGVALRAHDLTASGLPVGLKSLGRVLAGHAPDMRIDSGQCARIMTGALLPEGADTVVMQEDVEWQGDVAYIKSCYPKGGNVRLPGEQWKQGDIAVACKRRLVPSDLQTAAVLGYASLQVRKHPVIAILSSGDEVRPLGTHLEKGAVFDSNRQFLLAAFKALSLPMIDLGIVGDDAMLLQDAVNHAACNADLLVTTGGASQGEADHMARLLEQHGTTLFAGVAMKPGRPVRAALWPRQSSIESSSACRRAPLAVFALPGSPGAMMAAFYVLVAPAVALLSGVSPIEQRRITARLHGALSGAPARTEYVPARLFFERDGIRAQPSSHARTGRSNEAPPPGLDGLIELDAHQHTVRDGDTVTVLLT